MLVLRFNQVLTLDIVRILKLVTTIRLRSAVDMIKNYIKTLKNNL